MSTRLSLPRWARRAPREGPAVDPAGRHRAPALVERDRLGRALPRPYPLRRSRVRAAILVAGVLGVLLLVPQRWGGEVFLALGLLVLVAAVVLPQWLVPVPYPAFLRLRVVSAGQLQPQSWIRLHSGLAVQVLNVSLRVPDTAGDPTPPEVRVRCSDGLTRSFRPHDQMQLVQPVDLRRGAVAP